MQIKKQQQQHDNANTIETVDWNHCYKNSNKKNSETLGPSHESISMDKSKWLMWTITNQNGGYSTSYLYKKTKFFNGWALVSAHTHICLALLTSDLEMCFTCVSVQNQMEMITHQNWAKCKNIHGKKRPQSKQI